MIEFIDKSSENNGTPINRENMMGVQGFANVKTVFHSDGRVTETDMLTGYVKTTLTNADGSITETFEGEKTISKTTRFLADGSIMEEVR